MQVTLQSSSCCSRARSEVGVFQPLPCVRLAACALLCICCFRRSGKAPAPHAAVVLHRSSTSGCAVRSCSQLHAQIIFMIRCRSCLNSPLLSVARRVAPNKNMPSAMCRLAPGSKSYPTPSQARARCSHPASIQDREIASAAAQVAIEALLDALYSRLCALHVAFLDSSVRRHDESWRTGSAL